MQHIISVICFFSETNTFEPSSTFETPLPPQDHDFDRGESDFLNDNLIDFSLMREVTERFNCPDTELYIFSSFFYKRYIQGKSNYRQSMKDDDKISCREDLAYSYVEKWTKNVNIFKCKYLLIPVNKDIHWSLLIVCNPAKISVCADRTADDDDYFCILHLDSLGCHRKSPMIHKKYFFVPFKLQALHGQH